jgi:hypothetical protein
LRFFKSAFASIKVATASSWPACAAKNNGEFPLLNVGEQNHAKCRGKQSHLSQKFGSAPLSTNKRMMSDSPRSDAECKGDRRRGLHTNEALDDDGDELHVLSLFASLLRICARRQKQAHHRNI